jgi:hypothetical protein
MITSRRVRWVGYISCMGKMTNAYKILVGKSELKTLLKGLRHIILNGCVLKKQHVTFYIIK